MNPSFRENYLKLRKRVYVLWTVYALTIGAGGGDLYYITEIARGDPGFVATYALMPLFGVFFALPFVMCYCITRWVSTLGLNVCTRCQGPAWPRVILLSHTLLLPRSCASCGGSFVHTQAGS